MAIVIACLAAASEAAARWWELERLRGRSAGDGVTADFSNVDTSTCALGIVTTVHVDGSQGVITIADQCGHGGDSTTTETTTQTSVDDVVVGVYARCLATQVLLVTGSGEAEQLHLSRNFKTASLRAAFDGVDDANQTVSIAINLVWNGVGQKERTGDRQNIHKGGRWFTYVSSGTTRDAVAAGSVVISGTDRTPLPTTPGTIEKDTARELVVYR